MLQLSASFLSFEDVFVIGIGFDIAGAYLLAKGLLLSSPEILNLSSTYYGFSAPQIVSRVGDKISSRLGVTALVVGFLCQLAGYALNLALTPTSSVSLARAGVAILLASTTVILVLLIHRAIRSPYRRRLLIDISRYDKAGIKQGRPYGLYLLAFGRQMSSPQLAGESQSAYAKRVWRVNEITEGEPPD